MKYYTNSIRKQNLNNNNINMNSMNKKAALQMSRYELRADITEWFETASVADSASPCIVMTVVQRVGCVERQILPQEYKNLKAARMDSTRIIADVIADCGARNFTAEIRDDRFVVTTDNRYKITLVID